MDIPWKAIIYKDGSEGLRCLRFPNCHWVWRDVHLGDHPGLGNLVPLLQSRCTKLHIVWGNPLSLTAGLRLLLYCDNTERCRYPLLRLSFMKTLAVIKQLPDLKSLSTEESASQLSWYPGLQRKISLLPG